METRTLALASWQNSWTILTLSIVYGIVDNFNKSNQTTISSLYAVDMTSLE